jgi:hypothetical protein
MMINPNFSLDDVKQLPMAERRRLVAENPVLAAMHYEARSNATFDCLLNGRRKPLGTIIDRKRRIDDQRGGGSHEHDMLAILELKDLPDWLHDKQLWHRVEDYVARAFSANLAPAQMGYDDAGELKDNSVAGAFSANLAPAQMGYNDAGELKDNSISGNNSSDNNTAPRSKRAQRQAELPDEWRRPAVDDAHHPSRRRGPRAAASTPAAQADMRALQLTVQMHQHKFTCKKKGTDCRFNYPRNLQVKPKVLWEQTGNRKELQAQPQRNHHFVNNYNSLVLRGQRANHDVQLMCDSMGSSKYMMSTAAYTTATPRAEQSAANKAVIRAVKRLPEGHSLKRKMQSVSLAIVGSQEIPAQHAARFILGRACQTLCQDLSNSLPTMYRIFLSDCLPTVYWCTCTHSPHPPP